MRIRVLTENTYIRPDLKSEHGLSIYIEGEKKILFDAGQGTTFAENAKLMDVNLKEADCMVLSHGHYDHGGGISCFMEENREAPVYVSKYAFGEHYNAEDKYIGLDKSLEGSSRIITVEDEYKLADGYTLYSCNDRERRFPSKEFGLTVKKDGKTAPDQFLHEQYLLVEENGKKILFSGCSHKGILNIVDWFKPDVLVGGFHLMWLGTEGEEKEQLKQMAADLLKYDTVYYTCHCTGAEQYLVMKEIMGSSLKYIATGADLLL